MSSNSTTIHNISLAIADLEKAEAGLNKSRSDGTLTTDQWLMGFRRLRQSRVHLTRAEAEYLQGNAEAGEHFLMLAFDESAADWGDDSALKKGGFDAAA